MPHPFRQTLTSARLNLNLETFEATSERISPGSPPWAVRKLRLRGGRQQGVDLVEIDNGRLRLRVIPTRGMNVLDARLGDVRLGWDSPVGEVVHPMFVHPHDRGGLGWLAGFTEYIARCGLEWFGPPGHEAHHHAPAEPPVANRTLHGKIANTPTSELELIVDPEPPHRITLRGVVRERMLFGPKLDLHTEISTTPGSDSFRVADRVTNAGGQTQEFGLLYHCNHGPPILGPDSRFRGPVRRVTPATDHAAEGIHEYDRYGPPTPGFAEQVYLMNLHADEHDRTRVMLHNAAADRAVSMGWSTRELPCFTIWKNIAHEADGYVVGLEPATGYPNPREVEREAGRVPTLAPGDTWNAAVDYAIHDTAESVRDTAEHIDRIQNGREPHIDQHPV